MSENEEVKLSRLLEALPTVLNRVSSEAQVRGIAADSRQVQPGDLFVAIPGLTVDGHRFITEAVAKGAVAIVGTRCPDDLQGFPRSIPYVRVSDAREAWGWLSAAWRDFPSRKMILIGVTGTDGKTTTVNFVHAILRTAGINVGMLSTVSARIDGEEVDTGLHTTTPDPPDVQRYLARMLKAGATHAVLEVTSHGLAQHRVAGCDFDVAALTNITHEHLDFHHSLDAYRRAKARLFEGLTSSFRKRGVPKVAVLNRDDDSFSFMSAIPVDRQLFYAIESEADVTAREIRFAPDRTRFILVTPAGEIDVETHLVGAYNVSNALAAATIGVAIGLSLEDVAEGIAALRSVPGRMERIEEGQNFLALVDFAHTPNALAQALQTAQGMTTGRVIVVFGCAGLRDREKRPMMGRIAGQLADVVIITAEDPRTESLDEIIKLVVSAAEETGKREGVNLFRVPDRGEALLKACSIAENGDVVIACGKGHEQSMCFGATEYPWDDRKAMRLALQGKKMNTLPNG